MRFVSDAGKIDRLFDEIQQNIADLQAEFGTASELSESSDLPEYLRLILVLLFNSAREHLEKELSDPSGSFSIYRDAEKRKAAVESFLRDSVLIQSLLLFHLNFVSSADLLPDGFRILILQNKRFPESDVSLE